MKWLQNIKDKFNDLLNKIRNLQAYMIEKLKLDKRLHLLFGAITYAVFVVALMFNDIDFFGSAMISLWATAFVGVMKELFYDKKLRGGEFDEKDVLATVAGVLLFLIPLSLLLAVIEVIKAIIE